ncbi:SET and MYND domain-containing protein 4-like isoform X2 [Daphnia carinata]|uniref:SET and MYND domain-containing protein 4-like isoform X2 n=1 Tax=Daphnia carinata TaxID=120202 RepID=UPI002868C8F0|nr:SET and MYND domain-containing protein 4-like isoform X2 [Daphnia carinata]
MSRELSNWQELLDSFTETGVRQGKVSKIHQTRNNNAERIKILLEDEELRVVLLKWMNHQVKHQRSLEAAICFRETGNRQFSLKDYATCIELYSQSILSCPVENEVECSLAHANRSAALFQLNLFEDCLHDIGMALMKNYPNHLLPKILTRKIKCLRKLGLMEDCQTTLEELEAALMHLQVSEKNKIKSDIKVVMMDHQDNENIQDRDLGFGDRIIPFCGENLSFKGASAALDIRHSMEKGRYVVANRDIMAGETLFVEQPNALVVLSDFQTARCHHCTREMPLKRYPCLSCGKIWFCSNACRQESSCYHTFECGLESILNSVGIAHLGARIVVSYGLETVLGFLKDAESVKKVPGIESTYDTKSYQVMFHLVSHTERMAPDELYQYALTAAFLTLLLEQHTKFFQFASQEARYLVGGLILVHVCQMVSNAHAITELCALDETNERQERIATAIYPSASLMNHSCDPTVINSFQGSTLIVRAIREVRQGEEVFNCYGPHYRRMRRTERLELLESQYSFVCTCEHCRDANTEDFQDVIYSFACPSCSGSLVNPNGSQPSAQYQMTLCRSCRTHQSYFTQLKADLEAVSLDAREAMDQGDIMEAIKLLTKCVQLRNKALFKGHPDLGKSADKLAQCYAFIGKYEECEKMLRISLTAVEQRYGKYSIEMANELQKFTDVLMELASSKNQELRDELVRHLEEAMFIYRIHFGPWSHSYKELQRKKVHLTSLLMK